MTNLYFKKYSVIMALLIASTFLSQIETALHVVWQMGIGWLAAGYIVSAVRHHKLMPAIAWWLCAAGIFSNATGIGVYFICRQYLGYTLNDFPLPADGFWLMIFPSLVVGLSLLAHKRAAGQDWSTVIDAAIIVTGLSLLSWVFVVNLTNQNPLSLTGLFVIVAYPVGDLAVLGVLIRLLLQGNRNASLLFIVTSLTFFLIGDLCWALAFKYDMVPMGYKRIVLESTFLLAFAFLGAAAVHPSSREITQPVAPREKTVSLNLLIILAATSLVPSALLLYQAENGAVTNGIAIGVSSSALFLLVIIRVVGLLRKVELQAKQLSALSRIDELTGLYNRRAWMKELQISIERARREKTPLSVALIDLDFFKLFNDSNGHGAGDLLLQEAARAWQQTIRIPDTLGRYGGEEFILILPNTPLESANQIIDRLRPITPSQQTFSCGLALWNQVETLEHLLVRIDKALYSAKNQGRDRTSLANDE